jgi:hypothetical protein
MILGLLGSNNPSRYSKTLSSFGAVATTLNRNVLSLAGNRISMDLISFANCNQKCNTGPGRTVVVFLSFLVLFSFFVDKVKEAAK